MVLCFQMRFFLLCVCVSVCVCENYLLFLQLAFASKLKSQEAKYIEWSPLKQLAPFEIQ